MIAEILHLASVADLVIDLQANGLAAVLLLLIRCYPPFEELLQLSLAHDSDSNVVHSLLSLTVEEQNLYEPLAMWKDTDLL